MWKRNQQDVIRTLISASDAECNAIPHHPAYVNVHPHTPGYYLHLHCPRSAWCVGKRGDAGVGQSAGTTLC